MRSRWFGLLAVVLLALSFVLAACATPSTPQLTQSQGGQINVFKTPDPKAGSPTPAFPRFTIGAWPSNYSPNNTEHIKIYVLCRIQPSDMSKPPTPAAGVNVDVSFGPPVNADVQPPKPTGPDGLAVAEYDLVDPQSGVPVTVSVTANYGGATYQTTTFFTPNPTAMPTATPNPNASPSPSPGATATPTATPAH